VLKVMHRGRAMSSQFSSVLLSHAVNDIMLF